MSERKQYDIYCLQQGRSRSTIPLKEMFVKRKIPFAVKKEMDRQLQQRILAKAEFKLYPIEGLNHHQQNQKLKQQSSFIRALTGNRSETEMVLTLRSKQTVTADGLIVHDEMLKKQHSFTKPNIEEMLQKSMRMTNDQLRNSLIRQLYSKPDKASMQLGNYFESIEEREQHKKELKFRRDYLVKREHQIDLNTQIKNINSMLPRQSLPHKNNPLTTFKQETKEDSITKLIQQNDIDTAPDVFITAADLNYMEVSDSQSGDNFSETKSEKDSQLKQYLLDMQLQPHILSKVYLKDKVNETIQMNQRKLNNPVIQTQMKTHQCNLERFVIQCQQGQDPIYGGLLKQQQKQNIQAIRSGRYSNKNFVAHIVPVHQMKFDLQQDLAQQKVNRYNVVKLDEKLSSLVPGSMIDRQSLVNDYTNMTYSAATHSQIQLSRFQTQKQSSIIDDKLEFTLLQQAQPLLLASFEQQGSSEDFGIIDQEL